MHNDQGVSMHVARLSSLILAGSWLSVAVASSQQTTGFGPTLQLEKAVYVRGESIRFWIGVTSESEIPEGLRSSCVLHWVRPDGSKLDEQVSWPIDGDPSRGWKGGSGFGKQSPSLGGYVVSFEFAGQRTADETFEVVPNPFSDRIEAHWIFVDTKSRGGIHARSALLHVENKTDRALRFAKPGLSGSEVFLEVKAFRPPSTQSVAVPEAALLRSDEIPSFSLDQLEWSSQSRWPMVNFAGW